jgi:tetratricopeptide (TPR) repeat protein
MEIVSTTPSGGDSMARSRNRGIHTVPGLPFVVLLVACGSLCAADENPRLAERDRLWTKAQDLREQGKLTEAVAAAEAMLAIERAVLGSDHDETADSLLWLAECDVRLGNFAAARRRLIEARSVFTKHHGPGFWKVTDARLELADVDRLAALTPDQRASLADAERRIERALELREAGKSAEAIADVERAVEARERLLGPRHPKAAEAVNLLGLLCDDAGHAERAGSLYRQALEVRVKALGEVHPDTAISLHNVAIFYLERKDDDRAEPFLARTVKVRERVLDEDDPLLLKDQDNLAALYYRKEDYAHAEPLFLRTLAVREQSGNTKSEEYAINLNTLGLLLQAKEDHAQALPFLRRGSVAFREALGEEAPDTRESLGDLADTLEALGDKQ